MAYATPDDLAGWLDTLPDNPVASLRSASFLIAAACERNPYTDVPAEGDVAPLRDATCAQVVAWSELGVDIASLGLSEARVKRTVLLDATVEHATATQAKMLADAAAALCPETVAILTAAQLLYAPAPVSVQGDSLLHYGLAGPYPYGWWGARGDAIDAYSIDAEWMFQ